MAYAGNTASQKNFTVEPGTELIEWLKGSLQRNESYVDKLHAFLKAGIVGDQIYDPQILQLLKQRSICAIAESLLCLWQSALREIKDAVPTEPLDKRYYAQPVVSTLASSGPGAQGLFRRAAALAGLDRNAMVVDEAEAAVSSIVLQSPPILSSKVNMVPLLMQFVDSLAVE